VSEPQSAPTSALATARQIEYATGPRRRFRNSRLFRLLIFVAIAVLAAAGAWVKWGSAIQDRSKLLQVQRACSHFSSLAGQPVIPYDEGVSRYDLTSDWRAAAIAEPRGAARYHLAHRPRCLDDLEALLTRVYGRSGPWRTSAYGSFWATGGQEGIAFLHQRFSPQGEGRIVIVSGKDFWPGEAVLHASVLKPATWGESAVDVSAGPRSVGGDGRSFMELVLPQGTRLYVGQADPDDRSHFRLPYTLDKRRGTIDGWLVDGGTVAFRVRDGPLIDAPP
jgi:hypothetical protein